MHGIDPEQRIEAQAISRAQRGDPAGFEWLYNRYKSRVYSLCARMIENRAKAEELTQDTFLQVYRRIKTFRGEAAFSTWLHRIAVNVVLMQIRRERARISEVP
jgi:RNA polymerase sigma-70 factor (ECF subfamily)